MAAELPARLCHASEPGGSGRWARSPRLCARLGLALACRRAHHARQLALYAHRHRANEPQALRACQGCRQRRQPGADRNLGPPPRGAQPSRCPSGRALPLGGRAVSAAAGSGEKTMGPAPGVDLRLEHRDGGCVAHVTIDNRAKLNTLGSRLMRDLIAALAPLATHADVRAVVLTGAGDKAFIGGADIHEMAALDAAGATQFITPVHETCQALRRLPVPVIARIDGYALGAGLEMAAAADIRLASSRSRFGMPEVKVGIPSVVEAALLPLLIGWGRTRELLLFGETIDAKTALAWGLVERVVEPESLNDAVETYLASLFKAGKRAVRLQKQLIDAWEDLAPAEAIQAGIEAFVGAWETDEPRQRLGAFARHKAG